MGEAWLCLSDRDRYLYDDLQKESYRRYKEKRQQLVYLCSAFSSLCEPDSDSWKFQGLTQTWEPRSVQQLCF